eukprot:jgi/Mesvir1/26387/Mv16080-RA.1
MGVIDHHNALRQGGVAMSDIWGTRDPVVREISESLSMLITNGFFAMRQFVPGFTKSYRDYLVEAGLDLVNNERLREARATMATLELDREDPDGHTLQKLDCQSGCSQCRARQGRHPWTFRDRLGMDMCYTRRDGLTPRQPPGLSVIWRQMVRRKDSWQVVMKETMPPSLWGLRV